MYLKRLIKYLLLVLLLVTKSEYQIRSVNYIHIDGFNEVIPRPSNNLTLIINKIKLEVLTSYTSTLDKGLEIHKLSTRPGDKGSTIIILGHAGFGQNVYFNNLYKLNENDSISIDYSNILYNYVIEKKEIIDKGSKYYFEFNNDNLYLITCYKHTKQIIIKAKMAKN